MGPPSTTSGAELFTFTVTPAVAVTLVTWVVAVMVACVLAVTWGAVNSPEIEMLPILLLQFTRIVLEPFATALHWLLCRGWMAVGEQVTVIAVTGVTVTEVVPVFVCPGRKPH